MGYQDPCLTAYVAGQIQDAFGYWAQRMGSTQKPLFSPIIWVGKDVTLDTVPYLALRCPAQVLVQMDPQHPFPNTYVSSLCDLVDIFLVQDTRGLGCLALLTITFIFQTDVLKCVVSTDPGFRSHWLVATLCSFGRFLKAAFFLLLPER